MIDQNGGWDNSIDEVKKALDTLSYWLDEGVMVIILDKETGKYKRLNPFDSDMSAVMSV